MCNEAIDRGYKRTVIDEIDWVEIRQLHDATLKISKNCFEFKKSCIALIGAAAVTIGKLISNFLDPSYCVIPLLTAMLSLRHREDNYNSYTTFTVQKNSEGIENLTFSKVLLCFKLLK